MYIWKCGLGEVFKWIFWFSIYQPLTAILRKTRRQNILDSHFGFGLLEVVLEETRKKDIYSPSFWYMLPRMITALKSLIPIYELNRYNSHNS